MGALSSFPGVIKPAFSWPWGWNSNHSPQGATVRLIYRLFLDGKSIQEIKTELESRGILTVRGKTSWYVSTIRSILSNEKYRGDVLIQKQFTVDWLTKTVKKNEGEVPQYYVEGHHEPIIDPDVWDQVQIELATRHTSHGRPSTSKLALFSSRITCADCGGWYGRKVWHSTSPNRSIVWRCNRKYEEAHCTTPVLREHQIKAAFMRALDQLAASSDLTVLRQALAEVYDTTSIEKKLEHLEHQREQIDEEFTSLATQARHQPLDSEAANRLLTLEARQQRITDQADQTRKQLEHNRIHGKQVLASVDQLLATPTVEFVPSQWNALVDHATASNEQTLTFAFKTGQEITVELDQ